MTDQEKIEEIQAMLKEIDSLIASNRHPDGVPGTIILSNAELEATVQEGNRQIAALREKRLKLNKEIKVNQERVTRQLEKAADLIRRTPHGLFPVFDGAVGRIGATSNQYVSERQVALATNLAELVQDIANYPILRRAMRPKLINKLRKVATMLESPDSHGLGTDDGETYGPSTVYFQGAEKVK